MDVFKGIELKLQVGLSRQGAGSERAACIAGGTTAPGGTPPPRTHSWHTTHNAHMNVLPPPPRPTSACWKSTPSLWATPCWCRCGAPTSTWRLQRGGARPRLGPRRTAPTPTPMRHFTPPPPPPDHERAPQQRQGAGGAARLRAGAGHAHQHALRVAGCAAPPLRGAAKHRRAGGAPRRCADDGGRRAARGAGRGRGRPAALQSCVRPQPTDAPPPNPPFHTPSVTPARTLPTGYDPVCYLERHVPLHERIAFFSVADCAVVTATRDGMNLVPYEYVVCRCGLATGASAFVGPGQLFPGRTVAWEWTWEPLLPPPSSRRRR